MKRSAPVLLLFLASCAPKPADTGAAKSELPTVTVTMAPLQPMSLKRTVSVVGTLDPYKDVTLSPKVFSPSFVAPRSLPLMKLRTSSAARALSANIINDRNRAAGRGSRITV